jgi:S1-C subfamily serine protease
MHLPLNYRSQLTLIDVIFRIFTSKVTEPDLHRDIMEFSKTFSLLKNDHDSKICLKMGFLTFDTFRFYVMEKKLLHGGVPSPISENIIDALASLDILSKLPPHSINNVKPLYEVNSPIAKHYKKFDLLDNALFGFQHIIYKYTPSVFIIEKREKEEPKGGTGFYIQLDGAHHVITNDHVIKNADSGTIRIVDSKGNEIIHIGYYTEPENDLALLHLGKPIDGATPFILDPNYEILQDIVTIGYPPIAYAKDNFPLYHKGEINSSIETQNHLPFFIISAKTNPGNSGSPIINENGLVVGIITQALEHKHGYLDGKLPYYAGIPALEIIKMVQRFLKK